MSWNLRKANVRLGVTRFAPDADRPSAGLTAGQRAEHQARRAKETRKVFGFRSLPPCGRSRSGNPGILGVAAGLEQK